MGTHAVRAGKQLILIAKVGFRFTQVRHSNISLFLLCFEFWVILFEVKRMDRRKNFLPVLRILYHADILQTGLVSSSSVFSLENISNGHQTNFAVFPPPQAVASSFGRTQYRYATRDSPQERDPSTTLAVSYVRHTPYLRHDAKRSENTSNGHETQCGVLPRLPAVAKVNV